MFFRQINEEHCSMTLIRKKVKLGGLIARDKKTNIILKPANTSLLASIAS